MSTPRPAWWTALAACLLAAAPAHGSSLSLDDGAVILGRVESMGVTLKIDEPPGSEDRPLRLSVNVGSFGEVTRTGPGKYHAVYVPPPTRFPQVALVAVWRETGPDAPIEFLRIPLFGVTRIPVTAAAGAEVRIEVGPDSFGPLRTDRKGQAVVPAIIPPGVNDAVLSVKERSGLESTRGIPIEVPPYNRLTAALVPHAVLADGNDYARLLVLYDLGGADLPPDRVKLTASLGHAQFERAERGRYLYRYAPPAGTTETAVRFDVSVEGDPVARGSMSLTLGLPPPARVLVRSPGLPLPCDGRSAAPVTALVFDAAGLGLPSQTVEFFADGKPLPPARHLGNGLYEASYTAPPRYPPGGLVQFLARTFDPARGAITSSVNYQLRPAPMPSAVSASLSPDPVPADGKTAATLALDVRDGAGFPLDGASLILVASHGALGPLQAKGSGRYEASYTGPAAIPESGAFVRVVDSTGAFEARLGLPLREDPHRVLAGVRAGATHTLGDVLGPRVGLDLYAPLRLRTATLGLGLTASYGSLTQLVTDGAGGLTSRSRAGFLPVTLRLGYELYAGRQLSVQAGAGAVLTVARFTTSFNGAQATGVGGGGLGFIALGWVLGPGQVFAELSYAAAPVETSAFRLESGGLGLELGFRLGVL